MTSFRLLPLLTYIIGMYDPYGVSHSERVTDLALKFARYIGITDKDELQNLELAGNLHDIGKIGIPESIRRVPGKFLPAERMLMEQHPLIGEKILEQVMNGTLNANIRKIVRHHHENWDGTGYPDKVRGEDIPLGARIIRICDFFDARTNVRGYDKAMSDRESLQLMLEEQARSEWADPTLLSRFADMVTTNYDGTQRRSIKEHK